MSPQNTSVVPANKEPTVWIFFVRDGGASFRYSVPKSCTTPLLLTGFMWPNLFIPCWKQTPCPTAGSGEYQEADLGWDHSYPMGAYPRVCSKAGWVGSAVVQPGMQVREDAGGGELLEASPGLQKNVICPESIDWQRIFKAIFSFFSQRVKISLIKCFTCMERVAGLISFFASFAMYLSAWYIKLLGGILVHICACAGAWGQFQRLVSYCSSSISRQVSFIILSKFRFF